MKHLAAYLLLALGGNSSPSEKDVKNVLESVGIEADDERLSKLISELKGKDLQEVWQLYTYGAKGRMLISGSWSLRVRASWLPFRLVEPEVLPLLLEELLPLVVPLRKHPLLRRKRVCFTLGKLLGMWLLTFCAEKEESDEDMGFGLFD
jgi:ribosomal protein L12E/L44/L45/RPP1/RPP2